MSDYEPRLTTRDLARMATNEYIFDMIEQIADLARDAGETYVAVLLEAIIAARHAIAEDRLLR